MIEDLPSKWLKEAEIYARQIDQMRAAKIDPAGTVGMMSQLRICANELKREIEQEKKQQTKTP